MTQRLCLALALALAACDGSSMMTTDAGKVATMDMIAAAAAIDPDIARHWHATHPYAS